MEAVYNVSIRFLINLRPGHAISILWAQRLESGVLTENSSGSIITGETGLAHTRTDIKLAIMDMLKSFCTNSKTKHSPSINVEASVGHRTMGWQIWSRSREAGR
jgi:hypothetical protein